MIEDIYLDTDLSSPLLLKFHDLDQKEFHAQLN